jgi:hypothetical protein
MSRAGRVNPGGEARGGHPGAEPGGRDGQAGVAGKRGQPGQLPIKLGVAAAAGQAHPDDQALAGCGVAAEQVIGVLAHPAQPPDRQALPVQRCPDQIPELASEQARAAVHVFEYRSKAAERDRLLAASALGPHAASLNLNPETR